MKIQQNQKKSVKKKIVDANEKLVKELKNNEIHGK